MVTETEVQLCEQWRSKRVIVALACFGILFLGGAALASGHAYVEGSILDHLFSESTTMFIFGSSLIALASFGRRKLEEKGITNVKKRSHGHPAMAVPSGPGRQGEAQRV